MGGEKQRHVQTPPSLELVEFVRPHTSDKILYVTKISRQLSDSEGEVYFKLYKAFEQYGLIYEVQVKSSARVQTAAEGQQEEGSYYYAFVKFYLARDAARARAGLNGKYVISGQPISVQHATKMKKREPSPLPYSKCLDLANHFLGSIGGWSTRIVSIGQDPASPQHDPNSLRYICVMKIGIRGWDVSCEGVGLGERTLDPARPEERVALIGAAMKTAVNRALQNAFQKVILIVMDNGKVAVEINNTVTVPDGIPNSTEEEAHVVPVSVQDGETDEEDDMEVLLAQMESY